MNLALCGKLSSGGSEKQCGLSLRDAFVVKFLYLEREIL